MVLVLDPVCNSRVSQTKPPGGKVEHEGQDYCFCCSACQAAFERDPATYLSRERPRYKARLDSSHITYQRET